MTSSSGGFELTGKPDDETRLLVHELGYAIAVPGHPEIVAATGDLPRYDVVLHLQDVPVELGFRMDQVPTEIQARELMPALMTSYAMTRARDSNALAPQWLRGRPLPDGATAGMYLNYPLRGDDEAAMEFLAIVAKRTSSSNFLAMHMTVRYRRGDLSPFAWSHLRAALVSHHSWDPESYPSTKIWPERSVFVPRSARFDLSDGAMQQARAKAEEISGLLPGDGEKLADVLLELTNGMYAPTTPKPEELEGDVAQRLAACLPSRVTEVLMRNFHEIEFLHDFRGWLWQQYWAVMNRAELRKTN